MKRILLIGNGAREHVIGETLKKFGAEIFTYGKARNPGLLALSEDYETGDLRDYDSLKSYARKIKPDFAFIGPDDPIGDGMADVLLEEEIHSVAPLKTVARLESSKSFTRDLLAKYSIPGNPRFKIFYDPEGIVDWLRTLEGQYVIKADGLMAGKGVKVSGEHLHDDEEALIFAKECISAAGKVVIEEKFVGQEFSLMSFCDGKHTAEMPAVQDHKRAFDGDVGPNTGGMGTYSDANHSLPFLRQSDLDEAAEITRKVADALFRETGVLFKGIMYGGFIATASGTRLIEYNARFGDPEAMNVLPILETNFVDICEAILRGDLASLDVEFSKLATVCKYIVPEGYPDHPQKGQTVSVDRQAADEGAHNGARLYYASVDQTNDGLLMSGSRALAFVGVGKTLPEAEAIAAKACETVKGPVFYRKDVGTSGLIEKRVQMMRELRG